jgi:large subunit ribosomal protein L19
LIIIVSLIRYYGEFYINNSKKYLTLTQLWCTVYWSMQSVIQKIEAKYKKPQVVDVRSGDTVKVHQKIKEGNKERIQVFQGLVIRTSKMGSHTARILVRRITSGIGVEKSFLLHSPLVVKVEVTKRSKVRRNYLTYMRSRTGKSARLTGVDFDKAAVNTIVETSHQSEDPDNAAASAEQAASVIAEKDS